jgi:hypothetical protein
VAAGKAVMRHLPTAALVGFLAIFGSGCVGYDTMSIRPTGDLPVSGLSSEQTSQLKSAADWGEPSLISAAARMAWETPEHADALANYAANLMPDRAEEISAAVRHAVRR